MPRLFQPIQIRVNGGFQLHDLLSFFELTEAFSILFESGDARVLF
jgi:hypothetical protein